MSDGHHEDLQDNPASPDPDDNFYDEADVQPLNADDLQGEDGGAEHIEGPQSPTGSLTEEGGLYHNDSSESAGNDAAGGVKPIEHEDASSQDPRPQSPSPPDSVPMAIRSEGTPPRATAGNDDDAEDQEESASANKKRKRLLVSSDEESGDEGAARGGSAEPSSSGDQRKRRVVADPNSDESDHGGYNDEGPPKEVGALMNDIFGDDDDEEEDSDAEKNRDEAERNDEDGDADGTKKASQDEMADDLPPLDNDVEWDFDRMLKQKKSERGRKRRKHRNGDIDIINDDDGTIAKLVGEMKTAARDDRISNTEHKPALKKRAMLHRVRLMLMRIEMMEALIDGGIMSAVSEWLAPLPDKSLPALEIRTEILKLLGSYGRIDQNVLKRSGLGRAVMLLFKHPRETKENKRTAQRLISEWSRPIFNLDTDFRLLSKDERVARDYDHAPQALKRRLSSDQGPSTVKRSSGSVAEEEDELRPGDRGFVNRARVPMPSTRDYVVRPKSQVEQVFKAETKTRHASRLELAQRQFKERTRQTKTQRAIGVSIEGRKLDL